MRAENILERLVARQCIADLLGAGYQVSVNDGEEITVHRSTDATAIYAAMFTTDEDVLLTFTPDTPRKGHPRNQTAAGFVRFIYGNSGYDTINDYSTILEPALARTNKLTDDMTTHEGCDAIGARFALDGAQQQQDDDGYPVLTLYAAEVAKRAREIYAEHPEIDALADRAAQRAADKWEDTGDVLPDIEVWAVELLAEEAEAAGVTLVALNDD